MEFGAWARRVQRLSRPLCTPEAAAGTAKMAESGDWDVVAFGSVMTLLRAGCLADEDRQVAIEFAREGIWFGKKTSRILLQRLEPAKV
ncbi:MAG: hypothetical protein LKI24_02970 [Acidipropionibacterium sp.]|jgi:hypothetical protein|nr:hypothetical protein [Acidipropionibacterium sp.]